MDYEVFNTYKSKIHDNNNIKGEKWNSIIKYK